MPYTFDAKNAMLDALAPSLDFASLHTGFPGQAGVNEVAGGVPPYTRESVSWGPAAAGILPMTGSPSFDVPAGTEVKWVGFWSLAVAGTFWASAPLGATKALPFCAKDAGDVFEAEAHGFPNGQRVVLIDTQGAVLPTGVVEGLDYYVVNATADTFQVSLTEGGAAVPLTTDGAGFVQDIFPEEFTNQGVLTLLAASLNLNS